MFRAFVINSLRKLQEVCFENKSTQLPHLCSPVCSHRTHGLNPYKQQQVLGSSTVPHSPAREVPEVIPSADVDECVKPLHLQTHPPPTLLVCNRSAEVTIFILCSLLAAAGQTYSLTKQLSL